MSVWKEYKFSDFVEINPSVSLNGNEKYSYVEMKDLQDGNKYCFPSTERKPVSGARFQNGDTLFAKITPCLENGKICQVQGLKNNIGFGSTEFFVFRGKQRISDNEFVFYLSRWDEVRSFAVSNFEGTSGRQRVPKNCFDNLYLDLPDFKEQTAIAEVLSSLDDKIDLLHRQNKTLEQLAETLFKEWFVQSTEVKCEKLGSVIEFSKGRKPNEVFENYFEGSVRQLLIETFDTGKTFFTKPDGMIVASEKDILMVMDGASSGRVAIGYCGAVGSTIGLFRPLKKFNYPLFIFQFLKINEEYIKENTTGSAIPHADKSLIFDLELSYPDLNVVENFENISQTWFAKKQSNNNQINTLTKLRDALLPKLMSEQVKIGK